MIVGKLNKGILVRIALSIVLACAALAFFLLNRQGPPIQPDASDMKDRLQELSGSLVSIDRDVDSVLTRFGIQKEWIIKKQIPLAVVNLTRTERRVAIPHSVLPITINAALNEMAKRHDGRAVASENLKENTVTIHIEVGGYIIQTIIVRPTLNLKQGDKRQRLLRTQALHLRGSV